MIRINLLPADKRRRGGAPLPRLAAAVIVMLLAAGGVFSLVRRQHADVIPDVERSRSVPAARHGGTERRADEPAPSEQTVSAPAAPEPTASEPATAETGASEPAAPEPTPSEPTTPSPAPQPAAEFQARQAFRPVPGGDDHMAPPPEVGRPLRARPAEKYPAPAIHARMDGENAATQREFDAFPLRVDGVSWSPDDAVAIVNGRILAVGETPILAGGADGVRIESIERDAVTFRYRGVTFRRAVTLFGDDGPLREAEDGEGGGVFRNPGRETRAF